MALASIIATFGLLLNSTAVIIGAMIISPLMDPILGVSFASLVRNRTLTTHSTITLITGIALTLGLSFLIGQVFGSVGTTSEMLSRTKPNIMDLAVALAAGFLGAYVKVRSSVSGTVYGAAIAIALTPPLCVVGLGLALNNQPLYLGSTLLFLTNLASILFSSLLAFIWIDVPRHRVALKSFIIPATAVILLAIPLVFSFHTLIEEKKLSRELHSLLKSKTHTFEKLEIVSTDIDLFQKPIRISVTVRAKPTDISPHQVNQVRDYLQSRMEKDVELIVNLTPILQIRSEETPEPPQSGKAESQ